LFSETSRSYFLWRSEHVNRAEVFGMEERWV